MNSPISLLRALSLLALAGLALPLFAQQTSASLTGNVTDVSGGSIAGVSVKATNRQTNITRETSTNEQGAYTLPFLSAGEYVVDASKAGFQSARVNQLAMQVGQTVRVDISMQVGAITESVTVPPSPNKIETLFES